MKKFIIAFAATFISLGASAQLGIQAGLNFTDLKLSDVTMSKDMFSSSTGWTAGLTYDVGLPLGLGINTGLLFIQRNVGEQDATVGTDDPNERTALHRYSSLEIPLNLKYTFGLLPIVKPFVMAGPYMDCGIWNSQDGVKWDYGDRLNRITWGFTLGAGVDVVKHLRVMYQYDWGLTSLTTDEWSKATRKSRTNRISLGILF